MDIDKLSGYCQYRDDEYIFNFKNYDIQFIPSSSSKIITNNVSHTFEPITEKNDKGFISDFILEGDNMGKSKVYFTKNTNSESLIKLFKTLNYDLKGNICIKLHSGEEGNQNYVKPEFVKDIIDYVRGTVVECNTAYDGERNSTKKHKKLLDKHRWTKYFNVDLLDEENNDIELNIDGKVLKHNYVGGNLKKYNSMLVLSHFKGHPMAGYGGALKQLSIGLASSRGKAYIHSGGFTKDQNILWDNIPEQNIFLESMADAATSVVNYFNRNIVYINMMINMSVDCDCCSIAEDPCLKDMGMLISLDPVAIDKACIDIIENSNDPGKAHFMERINSRNGLHTIESAQELGTGSTNYELINIDEE